MKRRDFIRNTSLATAGLLSFPAIAKGKSYSLVSIRGGSPMGMLDLGIDALGGMSEFVKEKHKVLILPTLGWKRTPEQAANTNPNLLARLVELCYEAGSRDVFLFGQTHHCWKKVYKTSGIERAVKDVGAKILPGNRKSYYTEVEIPNGQCLKKTLLHQLVFETDVIINVPVLKKTGGHSFTAAINNLKNLMWKFDGSPAKDQNQCLLDILEFKKPVLNIIDANRVITRNAPSGRFNKDVSSFRTQIFSKDIVAADATAAKRLGMDARQDELLQLAQTGGFGQIQLPNYLTKELILKRQTIK